MTLECITPDVARALFEGSHDAVFICARGGSIVAANPAACRLFGMTASQLCAAGLSSLTFHPHGAGQDLVEAVPLQKTTAEVVFTRGDGSAFHGEVVVVPAGDGHAVLLVRDRSVIRSFGGAETFLRDLTHELRTPLASIRNTVYLLRHRRGSDASDNAFDVIDRQVDNVGGLIEDVADVARLVRGKVKVDRVPVDVGVAVKEVADKFAPLMQERGIVFGVMVPRCEVLVLGDVARVEQIIASLLHLVLRRAGRCQTVTVDVAAVKHHVRLSVRARSPESAPVVLSCAGVAPCDSDMGAGVTGALLKGLVELHGGTVAVSIAGEGESVTVLLPLLQMNAEAAAAPSLPPHKEQVLVVDDNRDAADSLGAIMKMWGHEVTIAYDAISALDLAARHPPGVILCDLNLSGMSGYELAEDIRTRSGETVVMIAISGYVEAADITRARRAGFDSHLAKPVDMEKLRSVIEGLRTTVPGVS